MDEARVGSQSLGARQNVSLLVTVGFGHSIVHWFGQAFPLLLAEIVASRGLSPFAAGAVMGARGITGAAASIPMGIAADRYAHLRTAFMTASVLWYGVAFLLIGIAPNTASIIAFAGFMGIGVVLWHPPAVGLLSTRFPERRATVMALHGLGASVGDITGPLLVGVLLLVASWEEIFRFAFIPTFLMGGIFLAGMRGVASGDAMGHLSFGNYFSALQRAVRHGPLLLSIVAGGTRTGGQVILMTFVPIYARDELDLTSGVVGVLLALLLGLSIVSQPVLAYISDRTSRKWTILPGAVVLTAVVPFIGATTGAASLFVVVCLVGLFMFSIAVLLGALGLDVAPSELHSSITAAQFIVGLGIGSIAPVVAGAIASFGGIESTFYLAAALFGVTALSVAALPNIRSGGTTPRFAMS